jgi:HEAT repeat protein
MVQELFKAGFVEKEAVKLLQGLLADKDSDVRQEARQAIVLLGSQHNQADKLVRQWMKPGESQTLALEVLKTGGSEYISPRKIARKASLGALFL